MLSLGEEEYIGGQELARAINEAKRRKMELLLAIADRETAVTYYKVIQIKLPGQQVRLLRDRLVPAVSPASAKGGAIPPK